MFPITIRRKLKSANGRNWPGVVILDPDCPLPAAVLAQEAWEAMHKVNPINLMRVTFSKRHKRRMEVMGHECEVQAAALIYRKPVDEYRRAEAGRMLAGYDGLFTGSRAGLIAAMEARSDDARRWVRKHIKQLERRK